MYAYAALHHQAPAGPGLFARLFAAWSAKASAVGPLIARLVAGRPVWPGRDYAKLAREGYQQNPIVYACVSLIAESVASIPLCVYRGKGDKRQELEEHPFLDLMESVNPMQDWQALLQDLVTYFLITGNLYCERTDESTFEHMELYAHNPERITIVPDPTGVPAAYEYRMGGAVRRFDMNPESGARPLLHFRTTNPTGTQAADWYGMSPLDPCAWAIDLHSGYSSNALGTLQNDGSPSGALVFEGTTQEPGVLDGDKYDRLLGQIRGEERGYDRKGSRMLLDGGKYNWLPMGLDAEKMQSIDAKNQAAREIAFTLGVPPELVGIPGDKTYSNYAEARQAFYQERVIPLARKLIKQIERWMAKPLGKDVHLELDLDDLDALSGVRKEQWERIEKSTTLSLNEKRAALGYEDVDGGDDHYVSAGQIPIMTRPLTDAETGEGIRPPVSSRGQLQSEAITAPPAGKSKAGPRLGSPPFLHEPSR